MKFLAALKYVKCFKCVSLLPFTPSISIPYKACSPKVFHRSAHECMYHKRQKFGLAKVWQIWRIDKICQTCIHQLTMRPQDIY